MKNLNFKIVLFGLLAFVLAACQAEPEIVQVTVEVEKEVVQEVQVEVTRVVEVEGEEVVVVETQVVEVVVEPTDVPTPQGGDVVESSFADINTLNPVLGNDNASSTNYQRMFLGLLKLEEFTGSIIGDIASDWTVSEDGLTYTFTLRDGVEWSDGRPLTAQDIVFTYDAINTDSVASPRRSGFDTVESYAALDAQTFEVQLKSLDCTSLSNWGVQGIIPAHVYNNDPETIPDNPENLAPTVVSGPFTFVEHVPDDHVTLAANPSYFRGQPNVDTWTYRVYADQSAELAGLLAGEVSYTNPVGPQFVSVIEGEIASGKPMQMRKWFTNGYTFVGYNLADPANPQNGWDDLDGDGKYTEGEPPLEQDPHPVLGDKLVRQAINTSIDYTGIINKVAFGQGGPIVANVWPSIEWAYNTDISPYAQDLEAAEALLDEAGWVRDGDEGVRSKDGVELTLKLMTNAGNETRENIGVLMKDTLDGIGFNIELDYKEFGTVVQELLGQTYDMLIIGFGGGAPEPDDSSQFSFKNDEVGAGFNFVSFYNEQFEANLDAGKAVAGCAEDERAPFYKDNQAIFYDEAPYAMLYVGLSNAVWYNDLMGFDPNAWDLHYNIEQWYLAP